MMISAEELREVLLKGRWKSHAQARQIVKHRFVLVNSRPVDVPSYIVKTGDVISIKDKDKKRELIRQNLKLTKDRAVPTWLSVDNQKLEGRVARLPERADIQFPIQEQLIVELYSK